jgi:hypothetical protein
MGLGKSQVGPGEPGAHRQLCFGGGGVGRCCGVEGAAAAAGYEAVGAVPSAVTAGLFRALAIRVGVIQV